MISWNKNKRYQEVCNILNVLYMTIQVVTLLSHTDYTDQLLECDAIGHKS